MSPVSSVSPLLHLRCSDVLPIDCAATWQSSDVMSLVAEARAHGALVHGFTSVWYTPERLAEIMRAITR